MAPTPMPLTTSDEHLPVPLTPEVLPAGLGVGPRGARDPLAVYLAGLAPSSRA